MDIMSFIPSQRQAILERFQQVEALGLGAVRIELKVANPVGIIYECYIMAEENYFSDQAVVSFRILYEKDLDRISLDVVDIPGRSSLSNYLQLLEIFEGLQNYLNREFAKVKNAYTSDSNQVFLFVLEVQNFTIFFSQDCQKTVL